MREVRCEVRCDEVRRQKTPKRLQCPTTNDAMRFAARFDVIAVPGAADASRRVAIDVDVAAATK